MTNHQIGFGTSDSYFLEEREMVVFWSDVVLETTFKRLTEVVDSLSVAAKF